jgi:hypothetical protein
MKDQLTEIKSLKQIVESVSYEEEKMYKCSRDIRTVIQSIDKLSKSQIIKALEKIAEELIP